MCITPTAVILNNILTDSPYPYYINYQQRLIQNNLDKKVLLETPQPIFFVNYQINIILFQNCSKNKEDKITNTYIGQNISK